jgi:phenylacetate-CoA ligase
MGLDFRIRDFAYPIAIFNKKKQFDKNQYLSLEALEQYQFYRLREIISHAYAKVPYYKKSFDSLGIRPSDIRSLSDTAFLPFLSKDILKDSFFDLRACDSKRFKPLELHTSGTTGGQVRFLVDKSSNILEFVYYWRFWGWHKYRLGDRFAEFSAQHFTPIERNRDKFFEFNPVTKRMLVNSLLLSVTNISKYISIFKSHKPLFLKGLPSNLYVFALLCNEIKDHGISFKAIFSQGENLFPNQKKFIEQVFSSPVFDSYGHLERTVAISQCPYGNYHIHSDYGLVEFIKPGSSLLSCIPLKKEQSIFEIVGTSLHNYSMPLIRYKTGDLVITDSSQKCCPCKRSFPLVHTVIGRDSDIIITPDKRAVTALYVALDRLPGIACGQIIQESLYTLEIRIFYSNANFPQLENLIRREVSSFTGDSMSITVKRCRPDELYAADGKKFKSIISHVDPSVILS